MKQVNLQLFGAFSELDASREIVVDVAGDHVADLRQALRTLLPQRWPQFRAGSAAAPPARPEPRSPGRPAE